MKKFFALTLAALMALSLAACGSGGGTPASQAPTSSDQGTSGGGAAAAGQVAGTYSVSYGTQEISGNVRHTGYLTARNAQEKNTVELKADGTYVYTKLISTDPDILATGNIPEVEISSGSASAAPAPAPAADPSAVLFSWAPNNEGENKGTCTLDFYPDGTYTFAFPSYGMEEKGTWVWDHWSMKVIKPSGTELEVAMDDESHALYFDYVSDANEMLHQNFLAETSAWGVALGMSGSYTPVESAGGASDGLTVSRYFVGDTTRKTADGNDYAVTIHMFLLSDGTAYIAEANDNNTAVFLGSWSGDTVTADAGSSAASGGKLTWEDTELSETASLPADYASSDWAALVQKAAAPAPDGPVVLNYVFTGTYTVEDGTVTLAPADRLDWSEDWGIFRSQGFTNTKGSCAPGDNAKVFAKGETGMYFFAMDHFATPFLIAQSYENNEAGSEMTNLPVKIQVSGSTFEYVTESVFD